MCSNVAKNTSLRCFPAKLVSKHFSLQGLLQEKLAISLNSWLRSDNFIDVGFPESEIVLKQVSKPGARDFGICYRWAIAWQLASLKKLSPWDVAGQLRDFLAEEVVETTQPSLNFSLEIIPPGWLEFRLSAPGLAIWLDELTLKPQFPRKQCKREKRGIKINLLPIQYAHARCLSLLQLGSRQKLLKMVPLDEGENPAKWLEPQPISWLREDEEKLRFEHPREQQLLLKLVECRDKEFSRRSPDWMKLSLSLSEILLNFQRYCRIFGELQQQNPRLTEARLGLVWLTYLTLRWLLLEKLGVEPRMSF